MGFSSPQFRSLGICLGLCSAVATAMGPKRQGSTGLGLDAEREAAAQRPLAQPIVRALYAGSELRWREGQAAPARVTAGETIRLVGSGFGDGPDVDYAKVLFGDTRALERDLVMYRGAIHILRQLFYEKPEAFDQWPADILTWKDDEIVLRVPATAHEGPLVVSVQKRTGVVGALDHSGAHVVRDPLTERIEAKGFVHLEDVVSRLGVEAVSAPVPLAVRNDAFSALRAEGEATYWNYEFNIGLVHHMRGLDWSRIVAGRAIDPTTGGPADPRRLFGAIPVRQGEVPAVAAAPRFFSPYPSPMPIRPPFRAPLTEGWITPTGYVGYSYAESIHPISHRKGEWIGFSCASCHSQRIVYEASPGRWVARVFPGLPNPEWTMKWAALGDMKGVRGRERGPDGREAEVDKTWLLFSVPPGTGEHSLVRESFDGSHTANDHLFSPIAIPIITRHTPVRRALSHSELVAGFEGSYIHAEEPDGAVGAMSARGLKGLTAYMSTLDADDTLLRRLALYRWLKREGLLDEAEGVGEAEFLAEAPERFPRVAERLRRGAGAFGRACLSCHRPNFDTWTNEDMMPLTEVGSFFSPTIFQLKHQSVRVAILRNLFWVEPRGLLHDGHVKSLRDLVDPDRCRPGSSLHDKYYTLHQGSFRVPKGTPAQERALRAHAYFVDVPWDRHHLYWDYQRARSSFGPRELGTRRPVPLPPVPHPWCATPEEMRDLLAFLVTL